MAFEVKGKVPLMPVSLTTGSFGTSNPPSNSAAATALDGLDHAAGVLDLAGSNVVESPGSLVDQQQVNALTLQLVAVVQPAGVDQGNVTLAILGNDLLGAAFDLVSQFGEVRSRVRERDDVACGNTHDDILS